MGIETEDFSAMLADQPIWHPYHSLRVVFGIDDSPDVCPAVANWLVTSESLQWNVMLLFACNLHYRHT